MSEGLAGNTPPSDSEMEGVYANLGLVSPGAGNEVPNTSTSQIQAQLTERLEATGQAVTTSSSNGQPAKEWHKEINLEFRNNMVSKLVHAIFPTPEPEALRDPRITNLIHYSRKVENEMYQAAESKEEYYHMLAGKIYRIQKELEEKRRVRQQQSCAAQAQLLKNKNKTEALPTLQDNVKNVESSQNSAKTSELDLNEEGFSEKPSIQRCIEILVHCSQCTYTDDNCGEVGCSKMKKITTHTLRCTIRSQGGCSICRDMFVLRCAHAKRCNVTMCSVTLCESIKRKFNEMNSLSSNGSISPSSHVKANEV